jgi:hypothetical protein
LLSGSRPLDPSILSGNTARVAFCSNCGRELSPAARVCPQCGTPTPVEGGVELATPVATSGEGPLEGFAVASLVCGIGAFFLIPIVGSILAIIFGHIATARIAEDPRLKGKELARAGIIIGWVGIVLTVLAFLVIILFVAAFNNAFS